MKNGTDAGSESRSKIYFDYAEQTVPGMVETYISGKVYPCPAI